MVKKEQEYTVKGICGKRKRGAVTEYEIEWENTWTPEKDLPNCQRFIKEYEALAKKKAAEEKAAKKKAAKEKAAEKKAAKKKAAEEKASENGPQTRHGNKRQSVKDESVVPQEENSKKLKVDGENLENQASRYGELNDPQDATSATTSELTTMLAESSSSSNEETQIVGPTEVEATGLSSFPVKLELKESEAADEAEKQNEPNAPEEAEVSKKTEAQNEPNAPEEAEVSKKTEAQNAPEAPKKSKAPDSSVVDEILKVLGHVSFPGNNFRAETEVVTGINRSDIRGDWFECSFNNGDAQWTPYYVIRERASKMLLDYVIKAKFSQA